MLLASPPIPKYILINLASSTDKVLSNFCISILKQESIISSSKVSIVNDKLFRDGLFSSLLKYLLKYIFIDLLKKLYI